MREIWRPIAGHEGYEVSDLGRVRSVDRIVNRTFKDGRIVPTRYTGRILKLSPSGCGYPVVRLRNRRCAYVHQLVLETFVGPGPQATTRRTATGTR